MAAFVTGVSPRHLLRANTAPSIPGRGTYAGAVTDYRLLTVRPAAEAHVVLGALQTEGIDARLERDGLGAVYGLTHGAFGTRILVPAPDYEAAVALLGSAE